MMRTLCLVAAIAFSLSLIEAGACFAPNADRLGDVRRRRRDGRRAGQRAEIRLADHRHGRQRRQAAASAFPDGRLAPGHYTLRIRAVGYDLAGPQEVDIGDTPADIAITLAQNLRPCGAAHQHRMADEHAGHGGRQTPADRMHELPQFSAHRALDLYGRRIRSGSRAHGAICQQLDTGAGAIARRAARGQR